MPTETSNLLVDFQLVPPSPDKPAETDEEDRHECNFPTQEETTTPVTFVRQQYCLARTVAQSGTQLTNHKEGGAHFVRGGMYIKQVLQDKFWTLQGQQPAGKERTKRERGKR